MTTILCSRYWLDRVLHTLSIPEISYMWPQLLHLSNVDRSRGSKTEAEPAIQIFKLLPTSKHVYVYESHNEVYEVACKIHFNARIAQRIHWFILIDTQGYKAKLIRHHIPTLALVVIHLSFKV